jgi:uncharacterized protein (DUF433 family)
MIATATTYQHIVLNEVGVPLIAGTTLKVVEIIEAQRAYGWSPEEYHLNHRYLTMGQIHSALAYYWDHKAELDRVLEEQEQFMIQAERTTGDSPFRQRINNLEAR